MRLLPSKRGHLYILERSRIFQRDGRVEYVSAEGREPLGFNIPVANTCLILIGPGSSITQEAVRQLKGEGVCFGFCGSGGTPLLSAQDPFPDLFLPTDEYRDPGYLQKWVELWRDEEKRLGTAKLFMKERARQIDRCWASFDFGGTSPEVPDRALADFERQVERAETVKQLLGFEGTLTKALYKAAARSIGLDHFERQPRSLGRTTDPNRLLDHGNYLAYGLASVVLWTLGIPASLAVMHGKTRRGALVFDLADVIKDAVVLPTAFAIAGEAEKGGPKEADFRGKLLHVFQDAKAMDLLFDTMKRALAEAD